MNDSFKGLNLLKFSVMGALLLACVGLEYYFHVVHGISTVYTHLFYVPIAAAAFWWGLRGGLSVSLPLGLIHIVFELPGLSGAVFLRFFTLVFMGMVMGVLCEMKNRADNALKRHAEELEQRVKERTAELEERTLELEAANEKLNREITERKKAEEALKQSYENLQEAIGGTINALAATAEWRDPYTAGHQQRVARLASAIAEEMNLPEEQIKKIYMPSLIHDIGKINVPSEILSKPGHLTELEFKIVQTHPQVGHDILKAIEFRWPIAQIMLQHHERMDGSGYPHGLSAKDIVLEARILTVADVVEAMCSHRPYRPALSIDEALEEISDNRGILYDPDVVDACLKVFTKRGFKFD
jgi:HD-GYP domain-containing protein (c-di-GMP phosphodiesterase class II)